MCWCVISSALCPFSHEKVFLIFCPPCVRNYSQCVCVSQVLLVPLTTAQRWRRYQLQRISIWKSSNLNISYFDNIISFYNDKKIIITSKHNMILIRRSYLWRTDALTYFKTCICFCWETCRVSCFDERSGVKLRKHRYKVTLPHLCHTGVFISGKLTCAVMKKFDYSGHLKKPFPTAAVRRPAATSCSAVIGSCVFFVEM